MSLETLLEAAEFLEWSKTKTGKRTTSRETRTSKRAEKFQPYVLSERKKIQSAAKSPNSKARSTKSAPTLNILEAASKASNVTKELLECRDDASLKDIKKCLGTRETHNKLEKNRRAHLKECFDSLREELPYTDERRTSNLATLRTTIRYIEQLNNQQKELEIEKRRMLRLRNNRQAHLTSLRKELKDKKVEYCLEDWLVKAKSTNSTSTATECGTANPEVVKEEQEENKNQASDFESKEVTPVAATEETAVTTNQPKTDENVQIVIKALPPLRTKPHLVRPQSEGTVTIGGSPQAIQMIQQAAIKASSNQRLQVQLASPDVAQTPAVTTVRTQPTAPVLVKVPTSTGTAQKIIFAPKTQESQPVQLGQVLLSSANLVVSPTQAAPVSAGTMPPLAVNLQTGRVITPRPPTLTTLANAVSKSDSNLAIAPKQVVLISTAATDQRQVKSAPVLTGQTPPVKTVNQITLGLTQPRPQVNTIRPVSIGSVAPLATLNSGVQSSKPTIITGMLPTTAADGTVSYVPVTLTTKPVPTANPAPPQLLGRNLTFVLPATTSTISNATLTAPMAPQTSSATAAPQKAIFDNSVPQ